MTPDRHHRWRIRLASGSKQAARATPTARSACFVPQSAMSKKTPRSFQCGNLTEVSVFCSFEPHFRYTSVEFHSKSDRVVYVLPLKLEPDRITSLHGTKKAQPHRLRFCYFRDPDRIRTCDPQLRRLLLYPAELLDQTSYFRFIPKVGANIAYFF